MTRHPPLLRAGLAALLCGACNAAPIDDGAQLGPLTQIKDGFTSAFLLETGGGAVLFDAGLSAGAGAISDALAERSLSLDDVTHVVVTHGHGDHLGGLAAMPDAVVVAHPDEQGLLELEGVRANMAVPDGGLVQVGDVVIEALHVPGHTAGSVVWRVEGVLVMGDVALQSRSGDAIAPPEGFSDDPARNDASVRALYDRLEERGDDIAWLAFAHSAPLRGLAPLKGFPAE